MSTVSVVVVSPTTFRQVRRTVARLRAQDDAADVQLVLVAPEESSLDDAAGGELDGFGDVRRVGAGPIDNVDLASAHGVRAADGDVVAFVEDHAFPRPGFTRALAQRFAAADAGVVMPTVLNGNPRHALSWCNLLLAYGWWTDPGRAGALEVCSGHNVAVRRDVLLDLDGAGTGAAGAAGSTGGRLEDRLGRGGTLVDDLFSSGVGVVLDSHARTEHVNPSTWSSTVMLRTRAGRLYAHQRAEAENWDARRRLTQAVGAPAIPAVRLLRLWQEQLSSWPFAQHRFRLLPTLGAVLVLDAYGQALGVLRGPGDAVDVLATFEMDRAQHLQADDVEVLTGAP